MKNIENQAPIFRFLNKHKWRIVLPLLFALFYFALPRYNYNPIAVQQELFIKSSVFNQDELQKEVSKIQKQVLSDEFLQGLISKYDLYKLEKSKNIDGKLIIDKLRRSIDISPRDWEFKEGMQLFIWINLREENSQNIAEVANDVARQFENEEGFQINKYVSKPYDSNPYRNYVFFGGILQGLIMLVIPLILLWEIPNMFYSPKTKKTVFDPIKSDWQNELYEAKLRNETLKTIEINFRYSFAYLSSMIQKSPIGDLIEFVRKIAS